MRKRIQGVAVSLLAICLAGCVTEMKQESGTVYVDTQVQLKGTAEALTQSDYENAVNELLSQMFTDAMFKRSYDHRVKEIPVIVSGSIRNEIMGERNLQRLKSMEETLFRGLRKSGLFYVKYDEHTDALTERIKKSANQGLEDGSLLVDVGTHASPDYYLTGALRRYVDDGVYLHELTLELQDLHTGIAIWTERVVIRKKNMR